MKNSLITFLLLFQFLNILGQDSVHLKKDAIKIENPDSLNEKVYEAISQYQLIMIGETHGSNEPASFVQSLAKLLIEKGFNVQIGLEIPSLEMNNLKGSPSDSGIFSSAFFRYNRLDGRGSFAWANLIETFIGKQNAEVFYFDIDTVNDQTFKNRDSLMYLNIKKRMLLHPSWITITLSGGIHNMLLPREGEIKTGLFLYNDKDLNIKDKLLSLKHIYSNGEVWDRYGDILQLYSVDNSNSIYARTLDFQNYLYIFPPNAKMYYNGVYFTRKITPSKLVNNK